MNSDDRRSFLLALDDELLQGGALLPEWCALIVREADVAFAAGSYLASILAAVSAIETYLRAESGASSDMRLADLIDHSWLSPDLRSDLHHLRRYRNRWVHVKNPTDDGSLLEDPDPVTRELETMAHFGARALRRTIYSSQWV
jgi:hypothetical protein